MSIKKEASKQWLEIHDKVLDGLDDNMSPRLLWDNQNVDEVVELAGITTKQAEIWLTKGRPAKHYSVEDQTEALVLFKALLVYNALIEEAKMTGAKDLVRILNDLKEAIIKLERREAAFESLGEMFFTTLNKQKQKLIRAKLRTVRGILNSTREITIASVVAVLFCELATSTDIREARDILETKLKAPFKSLVDAKGNLTSLAGCSIRGTHARLLKTAIQKALDEYSPNTAKVAKATETKSLAEQLKEIKDNEALTDSEKAIQQQKLIDESDLDASLKEVITILSDADVLIRGGELKTEVAVELGLTKDQEDAMLGSKTGMTLISAGAGSGKTRVLSGKVAHLLSKNDDVTPYNIMAVSFSRKSAQDLAEKVKDAVGSRIPQMSHTAIGRTTHSIAQEIVNRFHPQAGDATLVSDDFELDRLIKRAITLVKETAPDSSKVRSTSLFADQIDSIQKNQKRNDLSVLNLLIAVEKYRRDKGFLKAEEVGIVDELFSIREKLLNDKDLTSTEIGLVNRELDTERGDKVLNRAFGGNPGKYTFYQQKKTASVDKPMWWGSKVEGQEEVKINPKEAQLFITKCKANMVSPTEAYNRVNRPDIDESFILKAKVYGAYAHILTEEGLTDFDDMLIEAVKVLSRKTNLKQLQKQYKHIIVDEAQDLNPVQHAFFGLLSGTMEAGGRGGDKPPVPVEAPVMDNGRSITFIGDENQSIYGFRGAQSSEFSSKATQNEGAFDVMTLGVNFRSTKAIVDAANKLISEEEGSLGMVCTAVFQEQDNGSDSITRDTNHQSPYDAAGAFADRVKRGTSEDIYKASDYGVACRTNAELVPYALSLLEKDINFTCPVNPFKHPTTKKILRALGIGSTTIGASDFIGSFYGAFLNLHRDLKFDLGRDVQRVFKSHLQNPKKFEELEAQFKRLTKEQLESFFLEDLEDVNKTNARELVIVGSCLEVCENSEGLFGETQIEETNSYCSLVDDLLVARHEDPSSLFDLIVGNKTFEDGGKFAGPGGTLKDMIVGMSKTHADEMANALTTITSEEELQELKTVDFALAPLVALRSIFLKAVDDGGLERVFEKFRNLEISSQVAMKQSKDQGVEAVTLDTIHGWKGLEVTHLTVPMVAGKFPSDKEDFDPIVHDNPEQAKRLKAEQERMLAYVAVTRGKKSVTVQSYQLTGGGKDAGESEFISRVFGDCKKEASLKAARQILAETVEVRNDSLSDREIDLAIKMFG